MKTLFSPIGSTDPIRGGHDGAMLHICRYYKPDKVYLYLTGEMSADDKIQRVTYCFDQLQKLLDHPMEYQVISRKDFWEVQNFDTFAKEFDKILDEIRQNDNPDTLYVNVSSGTPAMKSALLLMSILSDGQVIPLQVSTPMKRMNIRMVQSDLDMSAEELWKSNLDNNSTAESRVSVATSQNWEKIIRQKTLKQLKDNNHKEIAAELAEVWHMSE